MGDPANPGNVTFIDDDLDRYELFGCSANPQRLTNTSSLTNSLSLYSAFWARTEDWR